MSSSVTVWARVATLSMRVFSGSASPALSNAARRWACDARPSPSRIRATSTVRRWVISVTRVLRVLRRGRASSERIEEPRPALFRVESAAHLGRPRAVVVQQAVLEIDARRGAFGAEAHLDLGLDRWIMSPVAGNLPGQHQAPRWIPRPDVTPIAFAAVNAPLEPATADEGLDDNALRVDLADVVRAERPPGTHLFREDLERALRGCSDDDALLDRDVRVQGRRA